MELDEEFIVESTMQSFRQYYILEEHLFYQLKQKVFTCVRPEEKHAINRYHKGSLSNSDRWLTNWNKHFEMTGNKLVAEVLLLNGLSDSPYSLRRLG